MVASSLTLRQGRGSLKRWQLLDVSQLLVTNWSSLVILMDHSHFWRDLNITSSTAQGGGGSFKNRKPIGEVGCCESGMAERSHWWTERCLISHSFYLFLWLSTYLPIYFLCIYLSIDLSIYLSLFHLITQSIYLSIHPSISLSSVYLSSCLPVYLSTCLSVYLSICGAMSFSVL